MEANGVKIVEDLQNWYSVALRERISDIKHIYTAEDCITLIGRVSRAEAQVAEWGTWGVVEIAVRNPNVASYVEHWEGRTERAEAQVVVLRDALRFCVEDLQYGAINTAISVPMARAALAKTAPKEEV